ncbi:ficolin-1-like [Argopecten irradians]|uniref:ficolin-1-like n=1 Tax=Argopecten irradians TaxID=31199 RepID=UPI003710BD63
MEVPGLFVEESRITQRKTPTSEESADVDFYRNWDAYKAGFGDLRGNFWIGNEITHLLPTSPRTLRVEMEGCNGKIGVAQYAEFQIPNGYHLYKLSINGFISDLSHDALAKHNGHYFTTYDKDNDIYPDDNCAHAYHGAWWYYRCLTSNLNGRYEMNLAPDDAGGTTMSWVYFYDMQLLQKPLKKPLMMVR